jgi:hypothetical protein
MEPGFASMTARIVSFEIRREALEKIELQIDWQPSFAETRLLILPNLPNSLCSNGEFVVLTYLGIL